jgi:hypothetical protein
MWQNYPAHELEKVNNVQPIEDALKMVENTVQKEQRRLHNDPLKKVQKDRRWEDIYHG